MRGLFITLEGVEGSGKSTMCGVIAETLKQMNIEVVLTREPGGTEFGEELRSLLLNSNYKIDPTAELLTMYAARAQHVNEKILPMMQEGKVVVCDRFSMSSYAYQGYGRGIELDMIRKLDCITLGDFKPDITFLFDVDVKTGMERVVARGKRDRFEQEDLTFFEKIRTGFLKYAEQHDEVIMIDSNQSLEKMTQNVIDELKSFLVSRTA